MIFFACQFLIYLSEGASIIRESKYETVWDEKNVSIKIFERIKKVNDLTHKFFRVTYILN